MNTAAWLSLITAGLFEIGWPIGIKMAQTPGKLVPGVFIAVVCMIVSGILLFAAQRAIPMGTAYAVWTGIGAAGTFLVGVTVYGEVLGMARVLAVLMIIGGVGLLKLAE